MKEFQFIQLSRAWYAAPNLRGAEYTDEVYVCARPDDAAELGFDSGFALRWYALDRRYRPALRLEAFDDSFDFLTWLGAGFMKALQALGQNPAPAAVCDALKAMGGRDVTPVEPD